MADKQERPYRGSMFDPVDQGMPDPGLVDEESAELTDDGADTVDRDVEDIFEAALRLNNPNE